MCNFFRSGDFRNATLLLASVGFCAALTCLFFKNEQLRNKVDVIGRSEGVELL